jgi:hypothetical protein
VTFSSLFSRNSRRTLVIEINPYQILAAKVSRPEEGPVVLERAAEFDRQDDAGLRQWLDESFERQRAWVPAICGFAQPEVLLQRDSIQPRKLAEPDYLPSLVKEQSKIEHPEAWKLHTLSPLEGTPLLPEGIQRPVLICGVSHTNVHQIQQRLLDHRLLPYRLEIGLLPLLGAISDYKARHNDKRATVVVVIEQEHTVAYILGKEGVHTPGPVRHGFASIVQMARKEFGIDEAGALRARLEQPDDDLLLRAARLVRAIGRDLKPLVDSYEMTTGQPVGEIYCAYLPPTLAWIAEPLAQMVGRATMTMDCQEWLPTVNLQAANGVPAFDQHWLGVLSLVAELPGPKPVRTPREDDPYQGPWHIDCRLSTHLPSTRQIRRRLLNIAVAATLAVSAVMFTLWQLYVIRSLGADSAFWDHQMAANQKLFDELNQGTRALSVGATRLDYARDLMAAPYPVSDFILNLGRSLPPHMRIDRIETNAVGLTLSGGLSEPSEQASRTLDRYVDELHRSPAIGPLFAGISLTSLQRENESDVLAFEITFKLKTTQP